MKKVRLVMVFIVSAVIGLTSCSDTFLQSNTSVEGTYVGKISYQESLKSVSSTLDGDHDGTAEISDLGDGQLEIHCFGGELDTTFMLNYYHSNDSVMVCLEGQSFENEYGHMMGNGNTSGGMMGSVNGDSEWMNHMNGEHAAGDEHYGGFDMGSGTFDYIMVSTNGEYHFQGIKQ